MESLHWLDSPDFTPIFKRGIFRIGWWGNYADSIGGGFAVTSQVCFWRPTYKGIQRKLIRIENARRSQVAA